MNTSNFNRSGLNLITTPDARMRETPTASTLAALDKRFGEAHFMRPSVQKSPVSPT